MPSSTAILLLICSWVICFSANAQFPVDLKQFSAKNGTEAVQHGNRLKIVWNTGASSKGQIDFNFEKDAPLFEHIKLQEGNKGFKTIASDLNPVFVLTEGSRILKAPTGWTIFFDNPYKRPYKTNVLVLNKQQAEVISTGSRISVNVSNVTAGSFSGDLKITLFDGSPLMKIEAVIATSLDSTAIVYDAGLERSSPWDGDRWNNINPWKSIFWADQDHQFHSVQRMNDPMRSINIATKYRAIVGQTESGAIAVFPAPHQYFFPEDNCYNLNFNWYGRNYDNLLPKFGLGIRQSKEGDKRFVPWFNAPPATQQSLNFFCLISSVSGPQTLEKVAAYTHKDKYLPISGYHTFTSHYHIEPEDDILLGKPVAQIDKFADAFKNIGVEIVHLASFHGPGHPKGPDSLRLLELKTSHDLCRRISDDHFLLLPGEEPDNFFGGHWIDLFPKPVYWVMSRGKDQPFVELSANYGKVYHIKDKHDMLKLLKVENGLAWTSHPRIKGSVGYPEGYKQQPFYQSEHFLGAAWKSMPADLSMPILGKRSLDVLNDMANWGQEKYLLGEGDLFKVLPEYELYGHMNINYLQLDDIPSFQQGWQPVLDALRGGKFFVTTGEILLPTYSVDGKESGETLKLNPDGIVNIALQIDWTFPLNFVDIIYGDGKKVYHKKIDLTDTKAFGKKDFSFPVNLKNQKWVRLEVWDAAVNGAFTQPVWLK